MAAVAVLLLVIGGLAAWAALRRGAEASAPVVGPTSTLAAPGNQVPSTVTPVSPSSVGPTAAPADPDTVQLAQGAAFAPAAPAIQALLQRHFDAINARDFTAWAATVTPDRAGLSAASWTQSFRSTHDSQVVISRIEPAGPDSATVSLSFTSTQDVQDAPPDLRAGRICWQSTWPVVNLSAGGRIGAPPRGTTTKSAC
ncbi:MAG: hypothetical protein L0H84_03080 [Pseudonocardia sp.]|nr:hypothetical protein [Pseudonocardia sp.]